MQLSLTDSGDLYEIAISLRIAGASSSQALTMTALAAVGGLDSFEVAQSLGISRAAWFRLRAQLRRLAGGPDDGRVANGLDYRALALRVRHQRGV